MLRIGVVLALCCALIDAEHIAKWGVTKSTSKFSLRSDPTCNFLVEMMHAQDMSGSFADDLPSLSAFLPQVLQGVIDEFPGSKLGAATFVDKPLAPFGFPEEDGEAGDWCLELSTVISETSPQDITTTLVNRLLGGGFDTPENQLGVLHDLSYPSGIAGWTPQAFDQNGRPIIRVISLSTDAVYHSAPDAQASPNFLAPNDGSDQTDCTTEDYPSVEQVSNALANNKIYTIFLVANGDLKTDYEDLMDQFITPGGVYEIGEDSSAIVEAMAEAFSDLAELTCETPTLDIVFAHDVTGSYQNDVEGFQTEMASLSTQILADFVAPSFGLTTFADKPVEPLGDEESGDYCYRQEQALTNDRNAFVAAAQNIPPRSGDDWWESQLDALMSSVVDESTGWRTGAVWNGFDLMRVVVLASDSGFHIAGDAAAAGMSVTPHSGGIVNCLTEDYPSIEQVASVLVEHDVQVLFVPTTDVADHYTDLLTVLEGFGVIGDVEELKDFGSTTSSVIKGLGVITRKVTASRSKK